jgi:hypothetical protein
MTRMRVLNLPATAYGRPHGPGANTEQAGGAFKLNGEFD